ncbi:hypothetical protein DSC45_32385 [Streptomyces sp. YIM 130001]|uniref:hypothetical protein n=1 Tax=Streptomyces sp. YIM 130001 TaxID=2259644 RepID=UPI000EBAA123|nr:hypothetical protein [Streptomyces sp. YIM 130001]RII08682.1 hypothetical protein DSC45_32385 [Streptomyces sp. YIM 130001]
MWYAQHPGRRTRQLVGDTSMLLWVALWAALAVGAHRLVHLLARPGGGAAVGDSWPGRAVEAASNVPFFGERLQDALRGAAAAGGRLVGRGDGLLVDVAAAASAGLVFLVPAGLLLAVWLPRRLRWIRQAAAAYELAGCEDGRELLALRSLMRPLDEVARAATALPDSTPGSLAEGWREGDPDTLDALAEAELARLGLDLRPVAPGSPLTQVPAPSGPITPAPAPART